MLFGRKRREREEAERREREEQERKLREEQERKQKEEAARLKAEQEAKAKQEAAQPMYDLLCKAMDEKNWTYRKKAERSMVEIGFNTEGLSADVLIWIDSDRKLVRLRSILPFKVKEDKRIDAAIAVQAANFRMVDGGFDYDITDGEIAFRMAHSYKDCQVETELFQYMIGCSVAMVSKYSAKFLGISTGILSLEDFLKEE